MIFDGIFLFYPKSNQMNAFLVSEYITKWLHTYCVNSHTSGFVVGVSGGVDSAVVSALCAMTGKTTWLLEMPIYQAASQVTRAQEHMKKLQSRHPNVHTDRIELTSTFDTMLAALPKWDNEHITHLALANTRARLRMTTLYYYAGLHKLLVAGTGNKVEDFGIGFYTKYGDGGVDLSPIADLNKSQVYELARHLNVSESIQKAAPTDGLWGDDRSDEDQIGASYPELEWAMDFVNINAENDLVPESLVTGLSERKQKVLSIYQRMNRANRHKMVPIPVCKIPDELMLKTV